MHFKRIIMAALMLHIGMFSYGQKAAIAYGNNPAAGKYYNIRGIKLYAEVYGKGAPLLLIHGNGGDISAFSKNIPYFAKKYQVIAVDSRSQGKSVDSKTQLSFEQMADDFSALLDVMHIKKAYVLGWSDGGINAILMAMRHPDKVIKLASTGANLWPGSTAFPDWDETVRYYQENKNRPGVLKKKKTHGRCLCWIMNSQI
jgi:pimeloyl-ACP methyl ester carboxylesterase